MTSPMNLARTVELPRRAPLRSRVEAAGATDRGRVRARNEDRFGVDPSLGLSAAPAILLAGNAGAGGPGGTTDVMMGGEGADGVKAEVQAF